MTDFRMTDLNQTYQVELTAREMIFVLSALLGHQLKFQTMADNDPERAEVYMRNEQSTYDIFQKIRNVYVLNNEGERKRSTQITSSSGTTVDITEGEDG